MDHPLALDLFCGGGGACLGLQRAGFTVIGVDLELQPDYPGTFILADALSPPVRLEEVDLIWASPPCQHAAPMRRAATAVRPAPNLVPAVQRLLAGHPYTVIEQVSARVLRPDLTLTMQMFYPDAGNIRRRHFQLSFPVLAPPPAHPRGTAL